MKVAADSRRLVGVCGHAIPGGIRSFTAPAGSPNASGLSGLLKDLLRPQAQSVSFKSLTSEFVLR